MIEPRLRAQNAYLVEMDRRIGLAKRVTEQQWYPSARAAVAAYLVGLLEALVEVPKNDVSHAVQMYSDATEVPTSSNADAPWPFEFAAQVRLALSEHQESEVLGPAHWVIGMGLMDALVRRQRGADDVWNVAHLASAIDVRIFAFNEAFQELDESPMRFVVEAIGVLASWEREHAARYAPRERRDGLPAALAAWANETDFGAIWDMRAWAGFDMYSDELGFLGVMCAERSAELLPVVESIGVPPLLESVLQSPSITMDMDRILALLDRAPPLLDPTTGRWNHKVAAGYLLKVAFEYVLNLGRPDRSNEDRPHAQEQELRALIGPIVTHTLDRTDGVPMLVRWLRHLVWRVGNHPDDEVLNNVFDATLDALAGSSQPLGDIYVFPTSAALAAGALVPQLAETEAELLYQNLIVAIMLREKQLEAGSSSTIPALRNAFRDLLRRGRHPFLNSYNERVGSWRYSVFATLYASETEPATTWKDDFDAFALERRASLHWSYTDDRTLTAPGLFLAGVGVALLDQCIMADDPHLRAKASPVWTEVFNATLPYFTHWTLDQGPWRSVGTSLFARLPACTTSGNASLGLSLVRESLKQVGGDETMFVTAMANLDNNGMTIATLAGDSTVEAATIARIASFLRWEASTGNRNLSDAVVQYWENKWPPDALQAPII
ncbi:hypothetical protein THICB1_70370 [Thiomonas arsenitoxydans]|uniref:Uncharacterized protein n=1 Tax=Thiomonas arsenitoxydans (strain DSM 22701 / CIP 110005 / 3As) TaxID=426114 RepID=A0ABM9T9P5_THIA3|nr:hypothetical protein [Thiomonas arsenitoxydans]CQR38254.1 hypothetical protein THICB1_70370 [Thiomonas arsenitoxydans]CQR39198.1 hypothetical protein THICB6_60375 [Thiomonas arsenitoxydans]